MILEAPTTIEQTVDCIRSLDRVHVQGGASKPALSGGANLSLTHLCGIVEYDPHEFTITALAGTPIADVQQALAEYGQQLAFDPPLGPRGATLGGTVAAGLSGPGRFRSGGVRDFMLGIRAVTGSGELFRGGGRVVKNSAGFDLPKLMVGSLGRFAVMVELTLKVFPRPQSCSTICFFADNPAQAMRLVRHIGDSKLDVECLDVDADCRLWVRVAGYASSPAAQIDQLRTTCDCESETHGEDHALWHDAREFAWAPEDCGLVKASIKPTTAPRLAEAMADVPWRISSGGHLAWIAWPKEMNEAELRQRLDRLEIPALALTGQWSSPLLGVHQGEAFAERLQAALDPDGKFARSTPELGHE